jgi:hypothetical protein
LKKQSVNATVYVTHLRATATAVRRIVLPGAAGLRPRHGLRVAAGERVPAVSRRRGRSSGSGDAAGGMVADPLGHDHERMEE